MARLLLASLQRQGRKAAATGGKTRGHAFSRRPSKECVDTAPVMAQRNAESSVAQPSPPAEQFQDPQGWGDALLKPSPLDGKLVLLGDDYPIEMDADGYPEIPACLDRRAPGKRY